ncbi:uncharacterized protein BXZ73DRAFT_100966 [Epithele typhae]|uniref:uncharacterized protein n=1 Tax=Epithele typhae TaxID=378194 RepID=UPI002007E517|nr:uncharacterized protein BXZ73DRAFT_100966 [Epithele typhae]KAH9933582.1 hypothetical protein BXZ73DRAFT_100966 [Epithele typhae]
MARYEDAIENLPTLVAYQDYDGEHQVAKVSEHSDHLPETALTSTSAQPSTRSAADASSLPSLAASSAHSGVKNLHGQGEAKTGRDAGYIPGPLQLRHCRLVVAEVSTFESSQQLVRTIYWPFRAHAHAYEVSEVLHGDVSAGNILDLPRQGWFKEECVRDDVLRHPTGILGRLTFTAVGNNGAAVLPLNQLDLRSARLAVHLGPLRGQTHGSRVCRGVQTRREPCSTDRAGISVEKPASDDEDGLVTDNRQPPSEPKSDFKARAALLENHKFVLARLKQFAFPRWKKKTGAPMWTWLANGRSAEDAFIG